MFAIVHCEEVETRLNTRDTGSNTERGVTGFLTLLLKTHRYAKFAEWKEVDAGVLVLVRQ